MTTKVWQDRFPRPKNSQDSMDMEKTFEEIKSTVLAFCDETCPKTAKNPIAVNGMGLEWIDYGDVMSGGLRLYGVADWMYIDSEMSDRTALHAYRLLGLDKRDALEAERGKAAKLVEGLEKIMRMIEVEQANHFGETSPFDSERYAYHNIARKVVDVYKKGGIND